MTLKRDLQSESRGVASTAALMPAAAAGAGLIARCTQIADGIVPEYRHGHRSYSCTGIVAKRWQAAWDGAYRALHGVPRAA